MTAKFLKRFLFNFMCFWLGGSTTAAAIYLLVRDLPLLETIFIAYWLPLLPMTWPFLFGGALAVTCFGGSDE